MTSLAHANMHRARGRLSAGSVDAIAMIQVCGCKRECCGQDESTGSGERHGASVLHVQQQNLATFSIHPAQRNWAAHGSQRRREFPTTRWDLVIVLAILPFETWLSHMTRRQWDWKIKFPSSHKINPKQTYQLWTLWIHVLCYCL